MNAKKAKYLRQALDMSRGDERQYVIVPHTQRELTRLNADGLPEVYGTSQTLANSTDTKRGQYRQLKRIMARYGT